jgi:3-methylcrotonyl-CoA carboxylase alpha subunit
MFGSVLIANRGEIAVRIIRTCQRLGIRAIAVYSEADRDAPHVHQADGAFAIGPAESARSYLDAAAIVAAARRASAEAIHPGYGFLSESETLIAACEDAGIAFVGPHRAAIRAIAEGAGVPVVPGYHGEQGDAALHAAAQRIGFPLLIKASAGGGGHGMRAVAGAAEFPAALAQARTEALAGFGDDRVLLEKLVTAPRHLEVQLAGDRHGNLVHLFERECSIQRNHQKIVEEAPAAFLTAAQRSTLHRHALTLGRAIGYDSLGTVEFLLDNDSGEMYFLEMNTRLQVEHPVTEYVTGLDLVEWQLRIAAGEPLPLAQAQIHCRGWAIEARVNAEDPARNYLPATGRIVHYREPSGTGLRVDSGVREGSLIGPHYDSLLAKVIAGGEDRAQARRRLTAALDAFAILGPTTNLGLLRDLLRLPTFAAEPLTTGFLTRHFPTGWQAPAADAETLMRAALVLAAQCETEAAAGESSPWQRLGGFRVLECAALPGASWYLLAGGDGAARQVRVSGRGGQYEAECADQRLSARVRQIGPDTLILESDGRSEPLHWRRCGDRLLLRWNDTTRDVQVLEAGTAATGAGATEQHITASLPGRVAEIHCAPGDRVSAGQTLIVLDSMKLLHTLCAPGEAQVRALYCTVDDSVEGGALLVELEAVAGDGTSPNHPE